MDRKPTLTRVGSSIRMTYTAKGIFGERERHWIDFDPLDALEAWDRGGPGSEREMRADGTWERKGRGSRSGGAQGIAGMLAGLWAGNEAEAEAVRECALGWSLTPTAIRRAWGRGKGKRGAPKAKNGKPMPVGLARRLGHGV